MNPSASLITDIGKAYEKFPAVVCDQCAGRGQAQRYGKRPCDPCNSSGFVNEKPCIACQQEPGQPGKGFILFPENIPCPKCQGKGTRERVRQTAPTTLGLIKVGDIVRVAVQFSTPRPDDLPAQLPHQSSRAELITCIVTGGQANLIQASVYSAPEYGQLHGLRFRSQIKIPTAAILHHHQSTAEEIAQAQAGNLFVAELPVIAAAPGEFFTRGGSRAKVFTVRQQGDGSAIAIGQVDSIDHDWHPTGHSRSGPHYDLVALSTGTAFDPTTNAS